MRKLRLRGVQGAAKGQIARNGAGAKARKFSSRVHENKCLGKGELITKDLSGPAEKG